MDNNCEQFQEISTISNQFNKLQQGKFPKEFQAKFLDLKGDKREAIRKFETVVSCVSNYVRL